MMESYLALVYIFAGSFAPRGFVFCQGQLLSINANPALFSLVGTSFGGNGQATFGIPDLRGRVPVGAGQAPGLSNYVWGEIGGTESVTLGINNIPAHTHAMTSTLTASPAASNADATTNTPSSTVAPAVLPKMGVGPGAVTINGYGAPVAGTTLAPGNVSGTITAAVTGGNQSFSIRSPYLALNYIMVIQGIFPSRN
ncbi:microcystin-dependent protein [Chitinophaga dinghuensis]|uniref:Microcystin-dependent protein n=1 Tax=Chitinophaga dinghuensis TaxID=1539050 RepID=A0A327VZ36_9BACT|nr:tail fiber protein [Chitinophaga dinghuensis]RAJ80165.1 microcystin-dependent protein [Chitinophaga dinghuensis]